jgi:hypothetical protein
MTRGGVLGGGLAISVAQGIVTATFCSKFVEAERRMRPGLESTEEVESLGCIEAKELSLRAAVMPRE